MPLFTIIIPGYNVEGYIGECLDSLIVQSFENFEVIVVDDGSMDRTAEITEDYCLKDDRFKLIKKENGGVSSARNMGIECASGEWIVFVDADDIVEKNALSDLHKAICLNPEAMMVMWGWKVFGENVHSEIKKYKLPSINSVDNIRNGLFKMNPYLGYIWNKAIKRDIIGELRFAEDIRYNEDRLFLFEYLTSVMKEGKCVYIDDALYRYRCHDNSVMSRFDGGVTMDLLTDLEAFRRMALIALEKVNKDLVYTIVHCAWYNIVAFRRKIHITDIEFASKFEIRSRELLSFVPRHKRYEWNVRLVVGNVLRNVGLK